MTVAREAFSPGRRHHRGHPLHAGVAALSGGTVGQLETGQG
ncbi:unnamed protein product [[Actinomadura] parvosata subsp. kistnae]|nr:unnamed protein product [Actinomadura parvosata subsp. kistnae]